MKLAPQPARRNLPAKPAPPNVSTCAQCASINSAVGTFHTLSKSCRVVPLSPCKFFRYRSRDAKRHADKPFRMNTCESVSKQRTLTTFRINTYAKQGRGILTGIYPTSSRPEPLRSLLWKSALTETPGVWPVDLPVLCALRRYVARLNLIL